MTFDMKALEAQLTLDEGVRFSPYKDTAGHLTVDCTVGVGIPLCYAPGHEQRPSE